MITWNYLTLAVVGALVLFLGFLFARKTALQFIEWMKAEQPRDKFAYRFLGFFYDWGSSRLKSKESLKQPANALILVVVEVLLAIIVFSLPFFLLKGVVLFLVAVILMGCAFFAGRTLRIDRDKECIPVAYILPLQIYAAIRIFVSLIIFIVLAIYEFFKSAIEHTSSRKPEEVTKAEPDGENEEN